MQDGKHVILCIDDDDDVLDQLKIVLEANDYVVFVGRCAEEGVALFRQHQPDLVVVDLMMEEIDSGTNFVKEIRALGARVPIFMLSSMGDSLSESIDYSGLGLAGVLQKPVVPPVLLKLIAKKLG
jgi:DNA-binding response OmpR family regulator